MKVALVIGHKADRPGACNKNYDICEFEFNEKLAHDVKAQIMEDIDADICYRTSYKQLPHEVNMLNPNLVISLHCNAYNTKATGTEVLYYKYSKKGQAIAQMFQDRMVGVLGLSDRGIKPKSTEDRGGFILRYTKAPCVLLEPFFIDNDSDYTIAIDNYDALLNAIKYAIYDALDFLSK